MEWLIGVFVPLGFFCLVAFIVWTVMNGRQREKQARLIADFNGRLLERIGSFKDFSDFLQTSGGATFMASLTMERGTAGPRSGVMRAVQIGIVLVALGAGFLVLARHFASDSALGSWSSTVNREIFTINGVVALSLGGGFLLASAVSYGMAKKLGLLEQREPQGNRSPIV